MIPLPSRVKTGLALAGAVALIGSHGLVYFKGRAAGAASVQAKYAVAIAKAQDAMRKAQGAMDRVAETGARAALAQQQETRNIYHETMRIIERPVYRAVCVDADGVGLLDRAAGNANRTPDFAQPAD